jgi:hypothetical protein
MKEEMREKEKAHHPLPRCFITHVTSSRVRGKAMTHANTHTKNVSSSLVTPPCRTCPRFSVFGSFAHTNIVRAAPKLHTHQCLSVVVAEAVEGIKRGPDYGSVTRQQE